MLVLLLLCICFGGTCCILQQFACLLACLLATDHSKADMGHHPPQPQHFCFELVVCWKGIYVWVCVCVFQVFIRVGWISLNACRWELLTQVYRRQVALSKPLMVITSCENHQLKKEEEEPPIICLLSHTHAYICACQVSESRWHPRPGFQTGSLSEISTVITTSSSSSSFWENCHLKERKKETTIISSFSPTHKIIRSFIIFFYFFCQVLRNLTIPQKKNSKFFKTPNFNKIILE